MFENVFFPLEFRKYQLEILANFESLRHKNEKKFHYIAPPGSGKTVLGLEIIKRIGEKAVVFSPNSAIQIQWVNRLEALTDEITISTEPFSNSDIISLTYQSITVKDQDSGELHENALKIIETIKKRKTVVLDECHHLVAYWAETIQGFIDENTIVLGLTATPPLDSTQKKINTYLSLVGSVDYEIPLPPVIKEKDLCPFQDLVYITQPTETELKIIEATSLKYKLVLEQLKNPAAGIMPIYHWAYDRLDEFKDKNFTIIPFDTLFLKKPDFCIALARYVKQELKELPLSVIESEEMNEPPTMDDMVLVLEDYSNNHLYQKDKNLYHTLKAALKDMGYLLTRKNIQPLATGIKTILGLSRNKLEAMKKIIVHEMLYMSNHIRMLILTDFEAGIHPEGTSAVEVMKIITSDEETDPIDPILVTGSLVYVDDDLLPDFLLYARRFIEDKNLNIRFEAVPIEGFYEIIGTGSDWNTKNYVSMITWMLERGVTKCLIGTRSLLGEGWDSIKLNTLIDLTVVASFVSVNQIRGRTLRKDEQNPLKVANNWDIITITSGERGFYDFERFKKKHAQFYGLSDDKIIEKGIGHVHPLLTNASYAEIFANQDIINQTMLNQAIERLAVRDNWQLGKPYSNYALSSLEIIPQEKSITYAIPVIQAKKRKEFILSIKRRKVKFNTSLVIVLPILLILFKFILVYDWGITCLILCSYLILHILSKKYLLKKTINQAEIGLKERSSIQETLDIYAKVVFYALQGTGDIEKNIRESDIQIVKRKDESFRVFLNNSLKTDIFSQSFIEVLSPIQNQKYIIERNVINTPAKDLKYWLSDKILNDFVLGNYHPVPSRLSTTREKAAIFQKYWNLYISPGELVYTRGERGKEIIKKYFRQKQLPISYRNKEIWQ